MMMTAIWEATIGTLTYPKSSIVAPGGDGPMRDMLEAAFKHVTGVESEFLFSGWGVHGLTESRLAVVEGRIPDFTADDWKKASAMVDYITHSAPMLDMADFSRDTEIVDAARNALVELLSHVRRLKDASHVPG